MLGPITGVLMSEIVNGFHQRRRFDAGYGPFERGELFIEPSVV